MFDLFKFIDNNVVLTLVADGSGKYLLVGRFSIHWEDRKRWVENGAQRGFLPRPQTFRTGCVTITTLNGQYASGACLSSIDYHNRVRSNHNDYAGFD